MWKKVKFCPFPIHLTLCSLLFTEPCSQSAPTLKPRWPGCCSRWMLAELNASFSGVLFCCVKPDRSPGRERQGDDTSHNMKSLTVVPIEEQDSGPHLHGKWSIKYFIVNIWKQLVFIKQCWDVQRSTVFLLLFLKYYTFWLRAHEQAEVHRNKTKVWAEKLWF